MTMSRKYFEINVLAATISLHVAMCSSTKAESCKRFDFKVLR
jgi:hypothetical protein